MHRIARTLVLVALCLALAAPALAARLSGGPRDTVETLSDLGDRSTGTDGCDRAEEMIHKYFKSLNPLKVGKQNYLVPVLQDEGSFIELPGAGVRAAIKPMNLNAVSPSATPPSGLSGPVVYAGGGSLAEFEGLAVDGAIVLMDMTSGKHWLNAAQLGAKALIYLDPGPTMKGFFNEAFELTPADFPRFHMPALQAEKLFGPIKRGRLSERAVLKAEVRWKQVKASNVWALIQGADEAMRDEAVVVEAFYDSGAYVYGRSPGADEAVSVATLLALAKEFADAPPKRSVMLVATSGHAQSLAGWREYVHAIRTKSRFLRNQRKDLRKRESLAKKAIKALGSPDPLETRDPATAKLVYEAVKTQVKNRVDVLSTRLMHLRLEKETPELTAKIDALADERLTLRKLSWLPTFGGLPPKQRGILEKLVPAAIKEQRDLMNGAEVQKRIVKSAATTRKGIIDFDLQASISLHLSSRGSAVGAFSRGWFYNLRDRINRVQPYGIVNDVFTDAAAKLNTEPGLEGMFVDSLRPSRIRPWQTYFADKPQFGGEIMSMAGIVGLTLATVDDARPYWGTPYDTPDKVDHDFVRRQARMVSGLVRAAADSPENLAVRTPRNGLATLDGHTKFIRQGDLFPDQAAPGVLLMNFQDMTRTYAMSDATGFFSYHGLADKKNTLYKCILEAYKIDPETGRIVWAVDKQQTGKAAYRVKMQRKLMETELIMFACKQTTLFGLLAPRTYRFMTRIKLFDGRRDAEPVRFWYSRIDTRESSIASFFLEPGATLKLTLSDNVFIPKMILTDADKANPQGTGYDPEKWPIVPATPYQVAKDMWSLLNPRVANLRARGISNERLSELEKQGTAALAEARTAYEREDYREFLDKSRTSWALATRVYADVEQTQKDVLMGVLFYIALFIPFAYCLERLLFGSPDIHKRIIGFLAILAATIAIIYLVHPAFQLTYSPMVVILAFFIVGLSLMVSLIIFFRFEKEMVLLQQRAGTMKTQEISRWKAFAAAFSIGVSNLRRRKLRTTLTCLTLVILTFTIMSFTAVKSVRRHSYVQFKDTAPYNGVMIKNLGWQDIPPEFAQVAASELGENARVATRAWLELKNRTMAAQVPLASPEASLTARGMIGLTPEEPEVSGIDRLLKAGRWFIPGDIKAVILPDTLAERLGADPDDPEKSIVSIWGVPSKVVGIIDGKKFDEFKDLDGGSLTPVVFPSETAAAMTEVEAEAIESGEDIETFQGNFRHISGEDTVIVPFKTLMAEGGSLKDVAASTDGPFPRDLLDGLVDRFGLTIFYGGPEGTLICQASDAINYSGIPNIVVPLVISVLIVLNTMISSVYERRREIGVYTSVGMAPTHVSYLFIAEALAFAVISVVLGYLLAQVAAGLLSGTMLWKGMTANYSSLAGVAAMVLVIVVVLVSVIYPSKVAGEIAIPDVNRSWRMPTEVGQVLRVNLPFLLKHHEQRAVGGFLLEYMEAHKDVSHGVFSSGDIEVNFEEKCLGRPVNANGACHDKMMCLRVDARVWLAPFDFGVKQRVSLIFQPSPDHPQFLEILVEIDRESGEIGSWRRINKAFLNDLRKQMLIWRSFGLDERQSYQARLAQVIVEGYTGL